MAAGPIVFIGAAREPLTGGEKYAAAIIEHLRGRGDTVETVTPADVPPRIRSSPLRVNRWLLSRFRRRLRGMTVIQDYSWHPRTFAFTWAARAHGTRLVCVVHHVTHRLRHGRWQRVVDGLTGRVVLTAAHRVIVNSRSTAADVASLGARRDRIVVVPPAVDAIPPEVTRPHQRGEVRLLAVGNVYERKGLHVLLDALADATFPFRLVIAGDADYDPAYRQRLDAAIRRYGLEDRVVLAGRADAAALDAAYRDADVFVAPSLWEGFGIALVEALLYGLPVVATSVGAIPELIDDGRNGLLVPAGETAALRLALERLAVDAALREQLSVAARRSGLAAAGTWAQVAERVAVVVDELVTPQMSAT
ncbi:MAG: glycosyltransferase family 4 protein [Chloroflexota bacterium]|nr:glycosyltransferase family 4 protein [Chloroflexota bacterium]